MPLIKKDGGELNQKEKLLYLGIVQAYMHNTAGFFIGKKFKKLIIRALNKLSEEDRDEVIEGIDHFMDVFTAKYEGVAYEGAILLHGIVLMDMKLLDSIGFDVKGFLRESFFKDINPDIRANNKSAEILDYVEAHLALKDIVVKRLYTDTLTKKARDLVLSKATTAFLNMQVEVAKNNFIPTVKLKDTTLIYFPRALIYVKEEEDGVYTANENSVAGTGGDLKSNIIHIGDDVVLGIKEMDGEIYIFRNTPYDPNLEESRLHIPKAYRYTLERENYKIHIHRWLNKKEYLDTYSIEMFELYKTTPITPIKKKKYVYKGIEDKVFGKAGVKRPDKTKSYIHNGMYVLVKDNGGVVLVEDGKRVKKFVDRAYRLNTEDEFNETVITYDSQKILL